MKEFNLNQYVGVKFTEEGLKILESHHNELLKQMPPEAAETVGPFVAPEVDEEGYSQIQLGKLMHLFGKYMFVGNPTVLFDMNIKISDEALIDHTSNRSQGM